MSALEIGWATLVKSSRSGHDDTETKTSPGEQRPDVDARQAGGSWAHSLLRGQGIQEGRGCHGAVVLFVAELI